MSVPPATNYHKVTLSKFVSYLTASFTVNELRTQDKDLAFGGFIPIENFSIPTDPTGAIRFYPCYDKGEVFLAFFYDADYNPNNGSASCDLDNGVVLLRSGESFVYVGNDYSSTGVQKFIEDQITPASANANTLTGSEATAACNAFFTQYAIGGQPANTALCSAFDSIEFLELINQMDGGNPVDIVGVNFFFGYDGSVTNKIRICLCAVYNDNGQFKNLLKLNSGTVVMFENGWPPA
jgi:hypothetical protein